jgi:acyl carrier protein
MNHLQITDRLKTILAEEMDLNLVRSEIGDSVSFLDDGLALDSITLAEFIDVIEKRFSIRIRDEDLDTRRFASLDSVAALINERLTDERLTDEPTEAMSP